jgi:hypothetical protein
MIRKGFPPDKCRLCGFSKSQGLNVYSASAKREGLLLKISKHLSKEVNRLGTSFLLHSQNIISSFRNILQCHYHSETCYALLSLFTAGKEREKEGEKKTTNKQRKLYIMH